MAVKPVYANFLGLNSSHLETSLDFLLVMPSHTEDKKSDVELVSKVLVNPLNLAEMVINIMSHMDNFSERYGYQLHNDNFLDFIRSWVAHHGNE